MFTTGCIPVFGMRFQFYFNSILEFGGIHWIPLDLGPIPLDGCCQNDWSPTGIGGGHCKLLVSAQELS